MLHFYRKLINEDRVNFGALSALGQHPDLEVWIPKETFKHLVYGNVSIQYFVWVLIEINLFKIDSAWIVILTGGESLGRSKCYRLSHRFASLTLFSNYQSRHKNKTARRL